MTLGSELVQQPVDDPRLGGAIVAPDQTLQESTSTPGSGALTMQIVSTVLGIAGGIF